MPFYKVWSAGSWRAADPGAFVTSVTLKRIFLLGRKNFVRARATTPIITGGYQGWPGTSLVIAESICDVPSELPTPPRPSAHQGGSRQDRVPSTRGRPEEQIMVAISFSKDLVGKFTLFFHFFVYPKWFRGTTRNDAAPVQHP